MDVGYVPRIINPSHEYTLFVLTSTIDSRIFSH